MNLRRNGWLWVLLLAWACGDEATDDVGPNPDGGVDAGSLDSGASDSGPDGGTPDSGAPDGGLVDPGPFTWPLPTGPITITPHASWKNRLQLPDDPFIVDPAFQEVEGLRFVKFAVLLRDPSKIYFQDSHLYPFHYEFASERLDPFLGSSRTELDRISLHELDQELLLGAVVLPVDRTVEEIGVQLVRLDAYHPEMVRIVFEKVLESLDGPPGLRAFYMPTYEQQASAALWQSWLAARQVNVSSPARWITQDACYSVGWSLGRLVQVPGSEIEMAYASGALLPTDILLTDGVPAEVPYVAGILSLTPSTPNAHVAILAQSYGVPFAFPAEPTFQEQARALVGHDVLFAASPAYQGCRIELLDLQGNLRSEIRTELLAFKEVPPLPIRPKQRRGAISTSTDELSEVDLIYFGGKAVGYALLRDTIPDRSPPAIALSFDLWDDFLDQTLASTNGTLRAEIDRRLSVHQFPPDPRALADDLAVIRGLIKSEAQFSEAQKSAVLAALTSFTSSQRLRFRSSTNVEDTDTFTGAGLYDSETGCAADDQDQDTVGPSACNAAQPQERGVFRALQKVYASFYNDNAVRERLRLQIDEDQVGMAVLVHYSYPDVEELANGVATYTWNGFSGDLKMVTQLGAVSITNPEGTATPEVVNIYLNDLGIYPDLSQRSSLVQLGATVLEFPAEYEAFAELFRTVVNRYRVLHPELPRFTLDFEYKKTVAEGLVVKQVRRLPEASLEQDQPVYLWEQPAERCTFQGETADIFSNHRLKVRYRLTPRGSWLRDPDLATNLYADGELEYVAGATTAFVRGAPNQWAGASHTVDGDATVDTFTLGPDQHTLRTELTRLAREVDNPIRSAESMSMFHSVTYTTPVPAIEWDGLGTRTQEGVWLGTCPEQNVLGPENRRVNDVFTFGLVQLDTAYYFPRPPTGITAGYTAPLYQWDRTILTGLTSTPIELRGYWSQTYRPGHHNFSGEFIFDPWLEPGLAQSIKDELTTANIRWVYTDGGQLWALGLDGVLRQL
ncbi:MAG: hypothetical protein IPG45_14420 [Deltaproteobacteria bacterium]|nr:hypothetical protein [Deltaproteobacteria bacterium]